MIHLEAWYQILFFRFYYPLGQSCRQTMSSAGHWLDSNNWTKQDDDSDFIFIFGEVDEENGSSTLFLCLVRTFWRHGTLGLLCSENSAYFAVAFSCYSKWTKSRWVLGWKNILFYYWWVFMEQRLSPLNIFFSLLVGKKPSYFYYLLTLLFVHCQKWEARKSNISLYI